MATTDTIMYSTSDLLNKDRVRYFPRQLLTADDMRTDQHYHREKLRRHNRYLHGWGVVCGCEVQAAPTDERPWQVTVCPGYVLTPQGDEIEILQAVNFDLAGDWRQAYDPCAQPPPCPPTRPPLAGAQTVTVYLAVCYTECSSRPVRIHPAGCGCDEAACEYSRIRDGFELVRLIERPKSHQTTQRIDLDWYDQYQKWIQPSAMDKRQVLNCPEYFDDNCVVLAGITLPNAKNIQIACDDIK